MYRFIYVRNKGKHLPLFINKLRAQLIFLSGHWTGTVTSHSWRILLAELLDDDIRSSASHQLMLQKCERVAGLPVLVCVHSTTEVTGFPLWSHAPHHVNELR